MNYLPSAAALVTAIAVLAPALADAQVLEPPSRPLRGLFGGDAAPDTAGRRRQSLIAQVNVLGGYDDNLTLPGSGASTFEPRDAGYIGAATARLRYLTSRNNRIFNAEGRGFMNTYRNAGVGPNYGGEVSTGGSAPLSRRSTLAGSGSVRYDPSYYLGAFASLGAQLSSASPDLNSTNSLGVNPSWSVYSTADLNHEWTRRLRSNVNYSYSQRKYTEDTTFDTRSHVLSVGLDRGIARTITVRGSYRYSDSLYDRVIGGAIPTIDQAVEVGATYEKDLSRTRRVTLSGGGGATYVDTLDQATLVPLNYWTPSGYATARYDFGRSWNVSADYRRSASVLQGLNPELFLNDTATVQAGGNLIEDIQLVAVLGYSNGFAGAGAGGKYDGYTTTGQMQFQLTRWWSALVSVNHYEYRLNTIASQVLGVSSDMHQNAIRVGFTWTLPLVGAATADMAPPQAN
jgi:hypothetical protein